MEEIKWVAPEFIEFEGRIYTCGFMAAGGLADPAPHVVRRADIRSILTYPSYFYVETSSQRFAVSEEQRDHIMRQLSPVPVSGCSDG